jgi:hypothetical protein
MNFPDYLKSNLVLINYRVNKSIAQADLQCKCGCLNFEVLYPGSTINIDGRVYPYSYETDTDSFFLIKVKCVECQSEYLIFDEDFHGWDGFYCHDLRHAALARPKLTPWTCLSCGQIPHKVSIKLDHTDRKEYEEMQYSKKRPFIENEWLLSFEWIWIGITCSNCNLSTPDWSDYETA